MSKQKWGESFLKSGLPLEHLTLLALKSIEWECELHYEYLRPNRVGVPKWFEHDVIAYSPYIANSNTGDMQLLMECKYHDDSRFWFFLPCETEDHLSQYGALSSGENLYVNSAVLHSAPYQMLDQPNSETLLPLAPMCVWGVTVSQDGTRQPNAIEEATKQLAYGFVPFCLESFYRFNRQRAVSVLPVIVTSANLFRLRPNIRSLEKIRSASVPADIADEVGWLWYYHAVNRELFYHNSDAIKVYEKGNRYAKWKQVAEQLVGLYFSPHWILVANIESLATAVSTVYNSFSAAPKDFSGDRLIAKIWKDRRNSRKSPVGGVS
ncbi:MAG: hypothetical protein ABSF79_10030 [Smithellaceae bacterium]|jgi:hypothetical protein